MIMMLTKKPISRQGMTLIEVMIALLVVAITGIGTSYFFVYGRGQVRLRNDYRLAGVLASEKLEELMATPYSDITAGQTTEVRPVQERTFNRTYEVTDLGQAKQVDVTVSWTYRDKQPQVTLTTQIAP